MNEPRRRSLPRFSLRSLILFVALCTSGYGLWYRWAPWAVVSHITGGFNIATLNVNRDYTSALAPDGRHYAQYAGISNGWEVWDLLSARRVCVLQDATPLRRIIEPSFSPDSKGVAGASATGSICIWDVTTGKKISVMQKSRGVDGVWFSFDGTQIVGKVQQPAAVGVKEVLTFWDASSGAIVREAKYRPDIWSYSRDGRFGVIFLRGQRVRIWNVEEQAMISTLSLKSHFLQGALFTQDNKRVVTFGYVDSAQMWNVHTGELLLTFKGHMGFVDHARLSIDDERLITSSEGEVTMMTRIDGREVVRYQSEGDKTIRIWDMRSGQQLEVLPIEKFGRNAYLPSDKRSVLFDGISGVSGVTLMVRRRPDGDWAVAWLPEFWVTVALAGLLVWSLVRDRKIAD